MRPAKFILEKNGRWIAANPDGIISIMDYGDYCKLIFVDGSKIEIMQDYNANVKEWTDAWNCEGT